MPARETITALRSDTGMWAALAAPGQRYRYCANAMHGVCNSLIPADSDDKLCAACWHNRTIPDLMQLQNRFHWRMVERPKHRLFYTVLTRVCIDGPQVLSKPDHQALTIPLMTVWPA
jgi:hypothetical protein